MAVHETGLLAIPYCEVGFLHRNKDYIFELCIPLASFWYKHCIDANPVPCRKLAPNYDKFVLSDLYSLHEIGLFAGPYFEVGFVNRNNNYIFWFFIPLASFWYKHCIGANTVPWRKVAPNCRKFVLSALYGAAWNRKVRRLVLRSGLFAPNKGVQFWALHSLNFPWYKHCICANTVPWRKVAPNFRKFALSALYDAAWNRVLCRPILRSGLSAPKQGVHFRAVHSRSFLFI